MKNTELSQSITTQKHAGETLSVFLERVRGEYGVPVGEKMTYAGRLDPMASGEMLVLWGEACKEKDIYLGRSKEYKVSVLLGVQTDTADMLGLVTRVSFEEVTEQNIQDAVQSIPKIEKLPYPAYSSKTVSGVPLWVSARVGKDIETIEKEVALSDVVLLDIQKIKLADCIDQKIAVIQKVQGDFRQEEIISTWEKIKHEYRNTEVQIVNIQLTASSGAYMRSLAEKIGDMLGVPALACSIERTKIFDQQ